MDSKAALEKIKEAEEKARAIIERARRESTQILHDAKAQRPRLIEEAREGARADAKNLKVKMEQEISKEIGAIREEAKEATSALNRKSRGSINKAKEFLKARLGL